MKIDDNDEKRPNAAESIRMSLDGVSKNTSRRDAHNTKQSAGRLATHFGIQIDERSGQEENTPLPSRQSLDDSAKITS
jgi:hypothetical protein